MLLNKSNLEIIRIVRDDVAINRLNNLYVCKDGSTVACSTKAVIMVSPLSYGYRRQIPNMYTVGKLGKDQVISGGDVKKILKLLPKDLLYGGLLENLKLGKNGKIAVNLGGKIAVVVAQLWRRPYINFKRIIKRACSSRSKVKTVVNLKKLIGLLQSLEKASRDKSGEFPVYIDVRENGNIIFRCKNDTTGQRVVGVMANYKDNESAWMPESKWEKKVLR